MAPLKRELQIELMKSAPERMEARVSDWMKKPQILAALRQRQSDLRGKDNYSVKPMKAKKFA
jgi:hypothetical protein